MCLDLVVISKEINERSDAIVSLLQPLTSQEILLRAESILETLSPELQQVARQMMELLRQGEQQVSLQRAATALKFLVSLNADLARFARGDEQALVPVLEETVSVSGLLGDILGVDLSALGSLLSGLETVVDLRVPLHVVMQNPLFLQVKPKLSLESPPPSPPLLELESPLPLLSSEQQALIQGWTEDGSLKPEALVPWVMLAGDHPKRLALLEACLEQGLGDLSPQAFELLARYGDALSKDPAALGRARKVIEGSGSLKEAQGYLDIFQDYGFQPEFAVKAIQEAELVAEVFRKQEAERIRKEAQQKGKEIVDSFRKEAENTITSSLTRNERKKLGLQSFQEELERKIKKKQQELSAGLLEELEESEKEQLRNLEFFEGPRVYEESTKKYKKFFADVKHHPQALWALELTGDDMDLAKVLLDVFDRSSAIGALKIPKMMDMTGLERCLSLGAPAFAGLLSYVDLPTITLFCTATDHLATLVQLQSDGRPSGTAQDLGKDLNKLKLYCGSGSRAALSAILQHYTVAELLSLIKASPDSVSGKVGNLAFLDTLRPHAAAALALKSALDLCKRARWTGQEITTLITGLGHGLSGPQLCTAIYGQVLGKYDRDSQFTQWVYALGLLIEDGIYELVFVKRKELKNGPYTIEHKYNVKIVGGAVVHDFVVHYHPQAKSASVKSGAYCSKMHVKPYRGNSSTPRVYEESIPQSIKNLVPKTKDA